MEAVPSSVICKAVVEEFAPRFLEVPGVIWLSESGNKVVARDDSLASSIGLKIEPDRHLPDMILVDLGLKEPLLVFVEVVASDGPITPARQEALLKLAVDAGFDVSQAAFVTAYLRSEEHTSELQSLMRISYAVFCLKKKKKPHMKMN